MSDELRRALKLILVTAQRPGEVAGIHTSEIDGNWWTIPSERAKNGKAHRVPASFLLMKMLEIVRPDAYHASLSEVLAEIATQ